MLGKFNRKVARPTLKVVQLPSKDAMVEKLKSSTSVPLDLHPQMETVYMHYLESIANTRKSAADLSDAWDCSLSRLAAYPATAAFANMTFPALVQAIAPEIAEEAIAVWAQNKAGNPMLVKKRD